MTRDYPFCHCYKVWFHAAFHFPYRPIGIGVHKVHGKLCAESTYIPTLKSMATGTVKKKHSGVICNHKLHSPFTWVKHCKNRTEIDACWKGKTLAGSVDLGPSSRCRRTFISYSVSVLQAFAQAVMRPTSPLLPTNMFVPEAGLKLWILCSQLNHHTLFENPKETRKRFKKLKSESKSTRNV